MTSQGNREYKRREFCNDIKCAIQLLLNNEEEGSEKYEEIRNICKTNCIHSTYEFHHWLIQKGFLILLPNEDTE